MQNPFSQKAYEALMDEMSAKFQTFGAVGREAYHPGLEAMSSYCESLGNPQNKYPCIHVAGTNGKGSTCNMTAAVLASGGKKVGLYTSPHILDFRERMRIVTKDGARLIPQLDVWNFLNANMERMFRQQLSYFEVTTVMAFDFFAREGVDIAVIECGLGGRLDATNIITPKLSIITNIGYDHMDILGNTLPLIAREKAGIIKPGIPVVIGESSPETDPVFDSVAREAGSPLHYADKSACEQVMGGKDEGGTVEGGNVEGTYDLKGSYQKINRRTVACALRVLGIPYDGKVIANAAHICDFHGRWEKVCDNPYTIADIGHNAHGLRYNFTQLENLISSGRFTDLVMVYGSVSDKDVDAVLRILPSEAFVFFTSAANKRAMAAGELMKRSGHCNGMAIPKVKDAVAAAFTKCSNLERPLLYIGGSTYVVSEALTIL